MKCIKVFNNSTVSTIMPDGQEAIVLGKGIGFNQRPGSVIREDLIEKVYYVQDEMQTKFLQMLQNVRTDVMEAAQEIIDMAAADGFSLSNQATISLIDHINFAMERQQSQLVMPNLLLRETHLLYPKEYALGQRALQIIQRRCGVALPEDEAGYIALHLVTISSDRNAAYDTLKFVKGTLDIICQYTHLPPDSTNTDMMRLIVSGPAGFSPVHLGKSGRYGRNVSFPLKTPSQKQKMSGCPGQLHHPDLPLQPERSGKILSSHSSDQDALSFLC